MEFVGNYVFLVTKTHRKSKYIDKSMVVFFLTKNVPFFPPDPKKIWTNSESLTVQTSLGSFCLMYFASGLCILCFFMWTLKMENLWQIVYMEYTY